MKSLKSYRCQWVRRCWKTLKIRCLLVLQCSEIQALPIRSGWNNSLTHFPSQPWCKMCVESGGHDSPHRELSKIDAVVPQLQFDYGCFLVGTDTSSGAIHTMMVPDSKKMDMPYVVAATTKVYGTWSTHITHKSNDMNYDQLISDPSTDEKKRARRSDDSILLCHMDDVVGTGSRKTSHERF